MRDGYKWLVKSIITDYLDLGDRVQKAIATERKAEEERRKEMRRRIEERRRMEEEVEGVEYGDTKTGSEESFNPPGFISLNLLLSKLAADDSRIDSHGVGSPDQTMSGLNIEPLSARKLTEKLELEPISGPPKKRGLLSKLNKLAGGRGEVRSLDKTWNSEAMDGEQSTDAHKGYRNWGLAEELEPTAAQ